MLFLRSCPHSTSIIVFRLCEAISFAYNQSWFVRHSHQSISPFFQDSSKITTKMRLYSEFHELSIQREIYRAAGKLRWINIYIQLIIRMKMSKLFRRENRFPEQPFANFYAHSIIAQSYSIRIMIYMINSPIFLFVLVFALWSLSEKFFSLNSTIPNLRERASNSRTAIPQTSLSPASLLVVVALRIFHDWIPRAFRSVDTIGENKHTKKKNRSKGTCQASQFCFSVTCQESRWKYIKIYSQPVPRFKPKPSIDN